MTDIKSMTLTELKELMTELGEKPFRAKQIYSWLHEHLAASWEEMTNLPKSLKQKLEAYPITALETVDVQISKTDGTRKYLFRLSDGNMIESVLMKYKYGNSVCISSQAGCRMGCRFCASTIGGLARNLLPSEMLDQIYRIQASIGERVSNVVVMGSGEPLDNYDNLLRFIHILTEEGGLHLSQRNLTVSTCGLVPKMYELAEEKLQMTLAVSLHAPNDEKRQELMPIAQKYREEMTNLPKSLKQKLEAYPITALETVDVQISKTDGTRKYLFRLSDGNMIESVLMKYKYGNSVCISSQAGCRMGCRFCASTIGGLARNLLPSEMLDQIYRIQASIGERVSNVVVMGSGEPLDNYDNLLRFIHILTEEGGLHLSQRNLTVSTCGLVPKMYELAEEKLQMTLAVSLHAPNDEKRQELMPIAKKYSMDELLEACRNYFDKTGRRITFEYSLVAGVNDSEENARELAGRLKGLNCHVNLIPVNPVRERSFVRSTRQAVENFKINLEKCGINGTIRREMGSDIDGACGQLRKRYMEKTESEK